VLDDSDAARYLGAEHLVEFFGRARAMQPGGNLDRDGLGRQATRAERIEQRGNQQCVGYGASPVGNDDDCVLAALRQFSQRRGIDRVLHSEAQRVARRRKRVHCLFFDPFDESVVWERKREGCSTVVEFDVHDLNVS